MKRSIILYISVLISSLGISQSKNYLQLNTSAGLGIPIQEYANSNVFTAPGLSAGIAADYYFGMFGLGLEFNQITNPGSTSFFDYVNRRFLEQPLKMRADNWKTTNLMMGPVFKFRKETFELEFLARVGLNSTSIPEFEYLKTVEGKDYMAYRFESNADHDYCIAYSIGTRVGLRLNKWLGINTSLNFFRSQPSDAIRFATSYRNVVDLNQNGRIDDPEFLSAEMVHTDGAIPLSMINVRAGFNFYLNWEKNTIKADQARKQKQERVILPKNEEIAKNMNTPQQETPSPENAIPVVEKEMAKSHPAEEVEQLIAAKVDNNVKPDLTENAETVIAVEKAAEKRTEDPINLIMPDKPTEIASIKKAAVELDEDLNYEEQIEFDHTFGQNFDIEASTMLYKAGEAYFASNDFESSYMCFNRLKEEIAFPMSKYMLSLSLAELGICKKSLDYFKEFAKKYQGTDLRTLEVLFNSHMERCKKIQVDDEEGILLLKSLEESTDKSRIEYKIQFLAMRKSIYKFPQIEKIGPVITEYFEDLNFHRYILPGYKSVDATLKDLEEVRKKGFRDAFIAVYVDGRRVETIYHN